MTITNTIGRADGSFMTKTEIDIHHANTVTFSRVIDSRIYPHTLAHTEEEGPITVSMVAAMSRVDDDVFKMLSDEENRD